MIDTIRIIAWEAHSMFPIWGSCVMSDLNECNVGVMLALHIKTIISINTCNVGVNLAWV
jgi:hypothetical protein